MRRLLTVGFLTAMTLMVWSCSGDDGAPTPASGSLRATFEYEVDYESTGPTSCPVRAIRFTDTSTGEPTEWRWQFPDGSTSTEASPTLSPVPGGVAFGASEVTLTVSRGEEQDSESKRIEIAEC